MKKPATPAASAAPTPVKFRAILLQSGKTATGVEVPPDVVAALGTSKKPAVKVTVNGYTYRSSVAVMGGIFMLGFSAEVRAAAGIKAGDQLDITLELDTAPREIETPADFQAALDKDAQALSFYSGLSYSNKRRFVDNIRQAKTDETRARRIAKAVSDLHAGKI